MARRGRDRRNRCTSRLDESMRSIQNMWGREGDVSLQAIHRNEGSKRDKKNGELR